MRACRILGRLWEAERSEPDIHLRSDYRQAFITVSLVSKGNTEPFISASYAVYGIAPEKIWPRIMADRKARLGKVLSDWYDQSGNLKPDIPKKTSVPVTPHPDKQVPARLAAVLMFPVQEVQSANVEQAGSVRGSKKSKGNLYEMPATSRSPASTFADLACVSSG